MKTREQKRREACDRIKRNVAHTIKTANRAAFSGNFEVRDREEARVARMQAEITHLESMTRSAS